MVRTSNGRQHGKGEIEHSGSSKTNGDQTALASRKQRLLAYNGDPQGTRKSRVRTMRGENQAVRRAARRGILRRMFSDTLVWACSGSFECL